MRKYYTLVLIISGFIVSCNSVKRTEKTLLSGDYDKAIDMAVKQLQSGAQDKNHKSFVALLGDAYQKAVAEDITQIKYLESLQNEEYVDRIYQTYLGLRDRQQKIKPLLPLQGVKFVLNDYTSQIVDYRDKVSAYHYAIAADLMKRGQKVDFRRAYDELVYVDQVNPNYKDTRAKIEDAKYLGTDFVIISLHNESRQFIPNGLMNQLINFNLNTLNKKWTVFDVNANPKTNYDFAVEVDLEHVEVAPEQYYKERTIIEKQIVDGWTFLKDKRGEFIKDSLGNKIKTDNYITVRCEFTEHHQYKAAHIGANLYLTQLDNKRTLREEPLEAEIIFENHYATIRGDRRALESNHLNLMNVGPLPFPTNEQMIYDAGEQLKNKIVYSAKRLF
ncbi:MAG: hypothetical protein CVT96_04890 [Bacteroidetes bacterium HGW-Bacteroidetes-13]|nr:MAG: hypothetical protein CVT96_04890 [Bacteroidetes bacterium HGW-Bacteroidetes-13]